MSVKLLLYSKQSVISNSDNTRVFLQQINKYLEVIPKLNRLTHVFTKTGIQMRNISKIYVFSIYCSVSFAGIVSGNSYNFVKRVDELVNITIADHLREVLFGIK